ncbi:uncharacterized protein RJT21DRAFT_119949 [Scheffersomyces amazonensis]|uniref:uncharacterized protein n=1 Tax=Scheffersomyces amazonensis TaxID=1078765 RepID=UPI00315CABBC
MKDLPRPLQNSFYLNYIYRTEYQLLFKIPEELSNYSLKEIDVLIETELHLSAEELEPEINKVEAKCSLIETKLEQNNNTLKELNAANIINKKQLEECTKNKKSLDQEYGQEIQNLFYLVIKQLILNTVVTLYHDDLHVILDIMQTNYNRTRIFRKRDIKTSEKVNPQSFLLEFMENHQFRRENNTSVQFSFVTNDTPVALYLELPFHEIERYEELFRDHFPKDAKYEIIDSYIPPEVQSALDNPHFMNNHEKLVRIYYVVILTSGQTPFKHRKHHHKDVKIEFMSYLSFCGRWHTTDHNKFKCPHFKKVNAHPARGQKRQ